MEAIKRGEGDMRCRNVNLEQVERGITAFDEDVFRDIISTALSPEQRERVARPDRTHPQQDSVLAVHWHPEYVPMELIAQRVDAMYPHRDAELIIPTQHNELLTWDGYAGVEVDCYSSGFNRKVQLLLHMRADKLDRADTLKAMLAHTLKYRSSQLFEFMRAVLAADPDGVAGKAAAETSTDADVVEFCRVHAVKFEKLVESFWSQIPADQIKNKLFSGYFEELRRLYDDQLVNKSLVFLRAVKGLVKENFPLKYFYRASEIIEEARSLNAGVVIPHPEQFWPILLADYDVDGIEVWNPQSRDYTEFLIKAVVRQNERGARKRADRPMLIFMGDDTHMSEKLKDPALRNQSKAAREIGLQPAWDDLSIRKSLIVSGVSRKNVIAEYTARLA